MKLIKIAAMSTAALLISNFALADDGFTPDGAFQSMLKLEGTWSGEAETVAAGLPRADAVKSTTTVSFKNIGNSSVMQTFAAGTPAEMISMYHQNGKEELIHTHYCAIGNQPSMTFASTGEQGVIDFKFTSGTNMDVNADPHAHNSYIKIIDEDTYETRTENWGGGKLVSYRYTTMKRVK
ncbi:MAG: hypothetical protein COA96_02995 [SAR86 cluster bacterium]|uniref:DUF1579 domain-containing protein n=1 Tax=SAR86 cluster bacterium TaxID=2030880 RepID=A0A2A5B823_9GAMM|nr:MAG: hypothetical protein COA96_02995 [SAR86 cluster bacterium]